MIIEIKVANYRSINAEQTFSFVAENAARHKDNLIPRKGYKLLKAVALFGANASGKSNLVRAIRVMRAFVRNSATRMNEGDLVPGVEPFRLDAERRHAPSRFEMTFFVDNLLYTYGFAADSIRVYEEWLKAQPEGARTETFGFQRTYNSKRDDYEYDCRGTLKPSADLLRARTRSNALALSTGTRENVLELKSPYSYFRNDIQCYDMSRPADSLINQTASRWEKDAHLRHHVEALLRDADIGIRAIRVEPDPELERYYETTELVGDERVSYARVVGYEPPQKPQRTMALKQGTDGKTVEFDLTRDESKGTQRLFALAGPFVDALTTGTFLVVDELDCSMHPLLTRKLLELFQSDHANPNGAQLLFTTHDPSLLDQELFRRDQVWIAEKREESSTFFSLLDIEPPPDDREALLNNYLAGRYGGTPYLGRAFDTLKVGIVK